MDVTTATTTTTTSTNISGRACCPAGSENQIKQSPYAGTTVNNHNHVEHQDQNEVRREEGATSNYSKQMNERRELGNGSKASSHFKAAMSYNDDNFVKLIEMERGQQRTEDWSLMRLVESADVKLNRIHNNNNMLADKEEGKSEENSSPASDDKLTNDDTTRKPFKAVHPEPASEQATIRSLSIGGGGARRKPTTTTKLLLKSPAFSRINNKPDEEAATNSIDTTMADIDTSSVRATVLANIQAPIQDGAQEQREPMQMELSRREQPAGGGEDCLMFGRKLSCSKVEAAAAGMTTTTTTMTANMTNRQKEEASSSSSSLKRSQLGEACEEESADKPGQSLDDKQGRTRLLDQQAGNAKTVDTKDVSRAAGELERTTGRQSAVLNKNIKQSLNCAPKTDVCARTSASALEQQLKWPAAESCAGRRAAAHLNLDKSWDDEELGLDPRDGCDSDSSLSGDLRGGPTPTNDLIRALIHKDRLAFKLGNRPHGLESKMMGGRHDDNNDSAAATDRAANVAAQAHHHHCLIGEPATGDLGGSSARQMDKNHDQERDNSSGPASKSSAIKFNCLADEAAKMEASRRRSSVFDDLSGLISKCHKLQLSAAPMAEAKPAASSRQLKLSPYQQFLNRYVSPRKPSDPTELLQAKQLLDDNLNNFNRSNRRHSTYMLPILLNSRAPKPGDELSDDDADSDGSGSFGNANDLADGAGERPADGGDLSEDDLDKDMVMIAERDFKRATSAFLQRQALPNSASSPSALSTPTNENPSGGKCKCCKLDFEQEASQTAQDQTNDDDNRWGLKQSLASSRQQLSKRKRLGSNPLDRLRLLELSGRAPIGSGGGLARRSLANSLSNSSSRKSSASELSQHQTSRIPGGRARIEPATKRHSIINIFSGHHHASQQQHQHGQALVSCLSNMPRALFSSHQKIGPLIATTNADQQQYEPLIPESGFKIVVMGTSGSGKTSIIQRFMYNSFTWRHSPTVEDTYFIEFPYMKNMINISISDTSGKFLWTSEPIQVSRKEYRLGSGGGGGTSSANILLNFVTESARDAFKQKPQQHWLQQPRQL